MDDTLGLRLDVFRPMAAVNFQRQRRVCRAEALSFGKKGFSAFKGGAGRPNLKHPLCLTCCWGLTWVYFVLWLPDYANLLQIMGGAYCEYSGASCRSQRLARLLCLHHPAARGRRGPRNGRVDNHQPRPQTRRRRRRWWRWRARGWAWRTWWQFLADEKCHQCDKSWAQSSKSFFCILFAFLHFGLLLFTLLKAKRIIQLQEFPATLSLPALGLKNCTCVWKSFQLCFPQMCFQISQCVRCHS